MPAWYSKRAKAMLEHKFKSHIKPGIFEERIFGNYTHIYGPCRHVPSRYVYCRYSEKRLRAFHAILMIDSHPELNGGIVPPFDEWKQSFFDEQHNKLMSQFT